MRIFGLEISRAKAVVPAGLSQPHDRGWWPVIREPFSGAWQRNLEERAETITTFHAVYACVTLIASDVAKCRVRLVERDRNGIWNEVSSAAFSPVLKKPNRYQNRIKFFEHWTVCKLLHGNTYALKERDERGVVVALYILDPTRTKPLVAPDGSVWYRLSQDNLSGIEDSSVTVPASEIIHDVMVPLFHPLCGVSPLTACGLAAIQGLSIQRNSQKFFQNGAMPSGVLTAPGAITDETANRLRTTWDEKFTGANSGKVAVLGDGLKYEAMVMKSTDAQMLEQLKWTSETVCSTFHVPAYMVGVGPAPAYNNIEALGQQYYSQCLQKLFECIEECLDEGLGLHVAKDGKIYGTEFDLDDLLRMDTATLIEAESKAVGSGIKKPNESRKRLNLGPVIGGDTPYLQEQNYALSDLAKRSAMENPWEAKTPAAQPQAQGPQPNDDEPPEDDDLDEDEEAARKQIAIWSLKDALQDQLKKMAA